MEGVDYNEVFSPVVKHSFIRILLAIAAYFDLELDQMNVKTAFLHEILDEEIHMSQPEGFIEEGAKNKVYLLKKSLYDLKQSPRQWYFRFDEFIMTHDYHRSQYDSCVYFRNLSTCVGLYLLLYVDDMLIACNQREEMEKLKEELSSEFEMKNLGATSRILGMQIIRDRQAKTLFLTQTGYVKKVINRFAMDCSKLVVTPLATHFRLSKQQEPVEDDEIAYMRSVPYSSVVGSIMYAMVCSRLDLTHNVCVVSRFMGNPGKEHWNAVKWVLRYLKG